MDGDTSIKQKLNNIILIKFDLINWIKCDKNNIYYKKYLYK